MRILITVTAMMFLLYCADTEAAGAPPEPALKPQQAAFTPLPLGAVRPKGWLRDELVIQANGLTGHLDEFWKDVGPDSAWRGGAGEGWERGPYYLDGLLPLAYILQDQRLIDKTKPFMEWMLASGQPNGWFGPAKNKDRWPLSVAMKVLTQYYEATGDERAMTLLKGYFNYLKNTPPDWPAKEWRGVRAGENVLTAIWLYRRTGDIQYLRTANTILAAGYDWSGTWLNFPFATPGRQGHPTHGVNIAMAVKYPGLQYFLTGDERFKKAAYEGLAKHDEFHGQVAGRYSADEHLAGHHPSQGTELCAIVEEMFSLSHLTAVFGDGSFEDRSEMLAYNGLPGTCTPDGWAHQYDQQANQVLCTPAKRQWVSNGDTSNLYGLEPNFGCCTANMHQGWPKWVSHLWMSTPDKGLVAAAYGPSEVTANVAGDTAVTITEETDYPFEGTIRFTVKPAAAVEFPLHLRLPGWAGGEFSLKLNGAAATAKQSGSFLVLSRTWQSGDTVELTIPMRLRTETRYNGAVAIYRGPLVFSLKIGEQFEKLKSHDANLPTADWAVTPTTPWNYGLILDRQNPAASLTITTRKVGAVPFANDSAPVVMKIKGKLLPQWGMARNSADAPPASPAPTTEPATELQLIPYGCTRLRITEFPTVQ